ncbi:hypothetical protein LTR91_004333 [Friedmanniomyces endolithicus]|uniref:AB hydrolase-1 domain-containing protein n=1 Tax=Friedmanniomyces endolithicus TaxID=329885 RepID=A0AAN6KW12_9PEZI|nr:hypothetical protein LTR94_005215 [Friedmanniomyces endolithicus]KAK0790064.1 hypothetical protein LTR59_009357 [Friedmanniomyces endolithicus]KAK0804808.1 hypothetical protein LTR38_005705 [Friedmanniomyces endolithicus]KAK0820978.1 hypothetical protein LTR75_001298 [Friedmanniomyces endolithicus]KAK0832002.1 hypothetical protein LTR03_015256 [Friedmanniomyces endolithicus]
MPPEPAYSFTIPSVEDDTTLECRIYHPAGLGKTLLHHNTNSLRGAIFAHPYAPLGGSYDDPVVLPVAAMLVETGYVVGTFNFRGAGGSHGKTSWTGKGEVEDYCSVVGVVMHYLRTLQHSARQGSELLSPVMSADERNVSGAKGSHGERPLSILLGGYSYGSLVLARLPPIQAMQQRFEEATMGTAAAEIVQRARTLAKQTLKAVEDERQHDLKASRERGAIPEDAPSSPVRHGRTFPVLIGGEETDSADRRRSRDTPRSMDLVRKSVDFPKRLKAHMRHGSALQEGHPLSEGDKCHPPTGIGGGGDGSSPLLVNAHYLLVSPVLLPLTTNIAPPGPPAPQLGLRGRSADSKAGALFLQHATLAIFGTNDTFTSNRRLRAWATKTEREAARNFEWQAVEGAGHFWREEGAVQKLRERVTKWVETLR